MSLDFVLYRQHAAREALGRFDFGTAVFAADDWAEDMRDALSCRVRLGHPDAPRILTFRVVFQPETSEVRDIQVGERLPLA
jgi:hypothetical protein